MRWDGANKVRLENRIKRRAMFLARVQSGQPRHIAMNDLDISVRQARRYLYEASYDTSSAQS